MSYAQDTTAVTDGADIETSWGNGVHGDISRMFRGKKGIIILTDGSTVNIDGNADVNIFQLTLGGNRTLTINNMSIGQAILLRLKQDATGNRSITSWFSGATVRFPSETEPSLSTGSGEVDAFLILCVDTDVYEVYFAGFGIK